MLLLFSSGREDIKKPPEPICTPVHGTEGKPRCHPNCPGELPDHSMPRDKGRVPSAPRRELREWKGPRLHRFAPATGSLSRRCSRSSHHSSQPAMLKQNCRFNSINISLSAAKVKGFFDFAGKNPALLHLFRGQVFAAFDKLRWKSLWNPWKTSSLSTGKTASRRTFCRGKIPLPTPVENSPVPPCLTATLQDGPPAAAVPAGTAAARTPPRPRWADRR